MTRSVFLILGILLASTATSQYTLPEGYTVETAFEEFAIPSGMVHTQWGDSYVWELNGKVWHINEGQVGSEPLIDISDEVGQWGEHGMMSMCLHPDFEENGYIYLLYNVDRYYLFNHDSEDYDPNESYTYTSGMGRVTRYTINTNNYSEIIPGSREIILGEEIGDGIPICAASHGLGSILFGKDGTLLISTGDGNAWGSDFNGEGPVPEWGYDDIALEDGIITEDQFLGGYRAQYLDGYNGKVLRIDPETGLGISSNPFFVEGNPDARRSRVWALGFRNAFRMELKPGTGSEDPADGNPGVIYLSDVGDWSWEEINVIYEGGLNFGWPMYQGMVSYYVFYDNETTNTNAPNPFYGEEGCNDEYMLFQDVMQQPNLQHEYSFPVPCQESQEIPDSIITFIHERPAIAYENEATDGPYVALTPAYDDDGEASSIEIGSDDSPVEGDDFSGIAGSGGVFLQGETIPEEHQGLYVQPDYKGWIRALEFNEFNEPQSVELWADSIGRPVHISQNPNDGCIYVTCLNPSFIDKICFGGNLKPIIHATPDTTYGTSPISVEFDASASYDPEGQSLEFEWDFGDGGSATGSNVSHEFNSAGSEPQAIEVVVTATDEEGKSAEKKLLVSLNNTPPEIDISSIEDDELYPMDRNTTWDLVADVSDNEHEASELTYQWTLNLHHNTHFHEIATQDQEQSEFVIRPLGCGVEEYWYEIIVDCQDPAGLTARDRVFIYPDCDGVLDDQDLDEDYLLQPNPTTGIMQLLTSFDMGAEANLTFYSTDGQLVASYPVDLPGRQNNKAATLEINLPSSGLYIMKVTTENRVITERIIYQKR